MGGDEAGRADGRLGLTADRGVVVSGEAPDVEVLGVSPCGLSERSPTLGGGGSVWSLATGFRVHLFLNQIGDQLTSKNKWMALLVATSV